MTTTAWDDEIALRHASIADARREVSAGEMSEADFALIEARERAAIARCEERRRHDEQTTVVPSASHPQRRHSRRYLVASLLCFAVVAGFVLVSALSARQPGDSVTGGVGGTTSQKVTRLLIQAEIDQASNQLSGALAAYNGVLALDPRNAEALTQSGWLSFSAGSADHQLSLVRLGESRVALAVADHPRNAAARLYYAIIATTLPGRRAVAGAQFRIFLALRPSATLRSVARPWLVALGVLRRR